MSTYPTGGFDSAEINLTLDGRLVWSCEYGDGEIFNSIIQQFTGLSDETGKEIFDGDILNSKPARYKVIWKGSGWKAETIMGLGVGQIKDLDEVTSFSFVLGNIFENPELLK
jgi:hypothetical protein